MAGWHHRLNGCEFEWTLGVGDGQGGLTYCNSWGHKELDTTEQLNWTELTLHISYVSGVTIYSLDVLLSQFGTSWCSMSCFNCNFLTCIQISQEVGQVVWYSHLLKNSPEFVVIHTVKGFGVVNKAEVDYPLELSYFFNDPTDVSSNSLFTYLSKGIMVVSSFWQLWIKLL